MRNFLTLAIFFFAGNLFAQPLSHSLLKQDEKSLLKNKAKQFVTDNPKSFSNNSLELISDSTVFIRIHYMRFSSEKYDYDKNMLDFLRSGDESFTLLINRNDNSDTLLALIEEGKGDRFIFDSHPFSYLHSWSSRILKVISSVELAKAIFFVIEDDQLLVSIDGKVFVLEDKQLIPFNSYYRKRFSLKEFKERY